MKKEALLLIFLVLVASFFFAEWTNYGEQNITGYAVSEQGVRVEKSIIEKVDNNETVRVKIKVKDDETIQEVEKVLGDKVKHKFQDKEEISAFISREELSALENNSEIDTIDTVRTRSFSLQDSVPLINSTLIWPLQVNGINMTGQGETICVIDTGADLDHPSLGGCFGDNDPDSDCKMLGGYDFCADDSTCTTSDSQPNDAHGHGTHVAGIVAANGTINGVAPGANLIIIKAGNSSGTFWDDDLEKAIEWCTNNASKFNISVISMSLGGGSYSSYCNSDPLADEIDAAVAANISVVVATGNEGSTSNINGPACVVSATPVGGSTKTDGMYSNGNRNSIVQLIAPGVSINSTIPNNAYTALSGTSMATPHVSGAIAVLNSFIKKEKGTTYTPSQLESILNDTGVLIDDSGGTGLKFSRIDVYGAVYSLDNSINNITLISPAHNSDGESLNVSFSCYAEDTFGLDNITFNLWNSTGDTINETTENVLGNYSYTMNLNISDLDNGAYTWNCKAFDVNDNSNWSSSNFTRRIGIMQSSLTSPLDNTYKASAVEVNYTCSSNDSVADLDNVTFYLWNSTGEVYNETKSLSGSSNTSTFNYTIDIEEDYEWNCYFIDNLNNIIYGNNNTLIYDATNPGITIVDPEDGDSSSNTEIDFEYTVVELHPKNCSLILDGDIDETDTSIVNGTNTFDDIVVETGSIEWQVRCYDYAGNTAITSETDLSISSSSSEEEEEEEEDSSEESSSVIPTTTTTTPVEYNLGAASLERGSTKELSANSKLNFEINDQDHSLTINNVYSSSAKITIASDPQTLIIGVGDEKKFDLTDDKVYDLLVKLNNIIEATSKANITVKSIQEEIGTREISEDSEEKEDNGSAATGSATEEETSEMSKKTQMIIIVSILSASALVGLGYLIYKKKGNVLKKMFKKK